MCVKCNYALNLFFFFSDHSIAGEGFAASYMILNATTSCGGDYHNAILDHFNACSIFLLCCTLSHVDFHTAMRYDYVTRSHHLVFLILLSGSNFTSYFHALTLTCPSVVHVTHDPASDRLSHTFTYFTNIS